MLRRNGTAVDAAVAALICISVVNAQSAGIGGGFLMTLYDRRHQEASALLARETAPANASQDMFVADPMEAQYGEIYGNIVTLPSDLSSDTHYLSYTTNYPSLVTPYPSHRTRHPSPANWHTHLSYVSHYTSPLTQHVLPDICHPLCIIRHPLPFNAFILQCRIYVCTVAGRSKWTH